MLRFFLFLPIVFCLSGCLINSEKRPAGPNDPAVVATRAPTDIQRIAELEQQLAQQNRQCVVDKRRLELSLKDSQKQNEVLQKKLDALLAIDRELRNRAKGR